MFDQAQGVDAEHKRIRNQTCSRAPEFFWRNITSVVCFLTLLELVPIQPPALV